jgi:ATP-binding cassette subfamily B protein/subfamily B ATP-binding cassette protein MsbA
MVAIVGPTGSGKSSIVNLLLRFYEFDSGDIEIDGISIRKISKSFLRQNVAIVTQESFLFNGTTAENLRVAKPHASDQELWDVLCAANADGFVKALPEGLNSPLGERGVRLSVGERQRISTARALLKNPPILILDEATASVDTNTEKFIQQALERLMADRTSFVIAHRLSTVRSANEIIVIDKGTIIERGCHQELFDKNGVYANLCRSSLV